MELGLTSSSITTNILSSLQTKGNLAVNEENEVTVHNR